MSAVGERWKRPWSRARLRTGFRLEFINAMNPNPVLSAIGTRLRLLRTEFVGRWEERASEVESTIRRRCWLKLQRRSLRATEKGSRRRRSERRAYRTRRPAGAIVRALVAETAKRSAEAESFALEPLLSLVPIRVRIARPRFALPFVEERVPSR